MKRRMQEGAGRKAFRKMRLVPLTEDDDEYETEKKIRHQDAAVTSMAQSMKHIRKRAPKKTSPESALALQNAYLYRLKRHSAQRAAAVQRRAASAAQPAVAVDVLQDAPLSTVRVPDAYRVKYGRLVAELERAPPGTIGRTAADELVIDGKVLRGTSFNAAVRGLYVSTNEAPAGTREIVMKLKQLHIPSTLVSSRYARSVYSQGGGGSKFRPRKARVRILRVY